MIGNIPFRLGEVYPRMDDIVDDVRDTLIESEVRVRRGATWFWSDFTCMFLSLVGCKRAANFGCSVSWAR
jgi:hypothetical protein